MTSQGSSSGFSARPSTGQGFTSKSSGYTDLSGITSWEALSGGNSMAASNTLTDKTGPQLAAPGSPSEGTADTPVHDSPNLEVGPVENYTDDV